jgi:hypothetical protein
MIFKDLLEVNSKIDKIYFLKSEITVNFYNRFNKL